MLFELYRVMLKIAFPNHSDDTISKIAELSISLHMKREEAYQLYDKGQKEVSIAVYNESVELTERRTAMLKAMTDIMPVMTANKIDHIYFKATFAFEACCKTGFGE